MKLRRVNERYSLIIDIDIESNTHDTRSRNRCHKSTPFSAPVCGTCVIGL